MSSYFLYTILMLKTTHSSGYYTESRLVRTGTVLACLWCWRHPWPLMCGEFLLGFLSILPCFYLSENFQRLVQDLDGPRSPVDKSGLFARISFSWISSLVGINRRLEVHDIPQLPNVDQTQIQATRFQIALQEERQNDSPSFLRLLLRLYGFEMAIFGIWRIANTAIGLTSPILLKYFLDWADQSSRDSSRGLLLAFLLSFRSLVTAVSDSQFGFEWNRFDLRIRSGLLASLHSHTLMLQVAPGEIGRIINLMSVDVGRLINTPLYDLFLIPLEVGVSLYLLAAEISYAFTTGLIVLGVMLPLQSYISSKIQSTTSKMLEKRDERVKLTSEGLQGVRELKLLGWIRVFVKAIEAKRAEEMAQLTSRKYLDAFCVFFWASTPVLVQTAVFCSVIYLSNMEITAASAFTVVALLNRLIFPMNYFPWIINSFLEALVSARRIRDYIFQEKLCIAFDHSDGKVVSFSNCSFTWSADSDSPEDPLLNSDKNTFQLNISTMDIVPRDFIVITGNVASGKSSLLLAILGEMPHGACRDLRRSFNHAAYAPQTPWILKKSIRENITLGLPFDRVRYDEVIDACQLGDDLDTFSNGDQTMLTESGSNLSGGQQLRIGLARALYQESDIYLLDDPTSAVDSETAMKIFQMCFGRDGLQSRRSRTTVLVTHSTQYLQCIDPPPRVLVLGNGEVLQDTRDTESVSKFDASSQDRSKLSAESKEKVAAIKGEEEKREEGEVKSTIWVSYGRSIGAVTEAGIFFAILVMQVSRNGLDGVLAYYTSTPQHHGMTRYGFGTFLIILTGINCVSAFFRSFLFAYGGLKAAHRLYHGLIHHLFHAPNEFFTRTPIGRILNRFSGDTYSVDESLPFILNILLKDVSGLLGALVLIVYGNPYIGLVLVPLLWLYFTLQYAYRPISRDIKRLECVTTSPLIESFTETLAGIVVLRGLKLSNHYHLKYLDTLDKSQRMSFLGANASSWFGIRLDLLGVLVTTFATVYAAVEFSSTDRPASDLFQMRGPINAGVLGLTLTYVLPIVGQLNSVLTSFVNSEKQMIAVERVQEYTAVEQEKTEAVCFPHSSWPSQGRIELRQLRVIYNTGTMALNNVSCIINSGEKIGIVGRTGSGKSSLLNSIFRIVSYSGTICIDNENIANLPLEELRQRLCCIPQRPVLFSGTIRFNLDPLGRATDEQMLVALRQCHVYEALLPDLLDTDMERLLPSHGQRQLLCLARALLKRSTIVCIDEATASIDVETDALAQKTIGSEFQSATVLTVAHRISTIIDSTRVLVLENGIIKEFDTPAVLLADPNTTFARLAQQDKL